MKCSKYFLLISIIFAACYQGVNAADYVTEVENNQGAIYNNDDTDRLIHGATLISNNIMLTTATLIKNEKLKYTGKMVKNCLDNNEVKATIRVIYYNYQDDHYYNNFGLLIFPVNMVQGTDLKPAKLVIPNVDINTYVTSIITGLGKDPDLHVVTNTMKMIKCKSNKNNQTICSVDSDEEHTCILTQGGGMFVTVTGKDATYYALAGVVINLSYLDDCDEDKPARVLKTNAADVFKWIQSIISTKSL